MSRVVTAAIIVGGLALAGGFTIRPSISPDGALTLAPPAGAPSLGEAIGGGADRVIGSAGDELGDALGTSDLAKGLSLGAGGYGAYKGAQKLRNWRATPPSVTTPPTVTTPTTGREVWCADGSGGLVKMPPPCPAVAPTTTTVTTAPPATTATTAAKPAQAPTVVGVTTTTAKPLAPWVTTIKPGLNATPKLDLGGVAR